MVRVLAVLLAGPLAVLLAGLAASARAQTATVVYEGQSLTIANFATSPAALHDNSSLYDQEAWFGNATLAQAVCNLIGGDLGAPNGADGPCFIYEKVFGAPTVFNGYLWDGSCRTEQYIYADTNDLVIAQQVPLVGPNCTSPLFSPLTLSSRLNSQVCTANKDARTGKVPKLSTLVTLSLPPDANNEIPTIDITDIVMNSATASWKCRCRPTRRDNCSCIPNAVLLGGGSFRVMPQWRRSTLPGAIVDTAFQVSFNASTSSGSCSGTASICATWGVRPNRPPPVCQAFNATGVTRPALTCI